MADVIIKHVPLEVTLETSDLDMEIESNEIAEIDLEVNAWGSGSGGGNADMSNYLAKDNVIPYTPTDDYHPATKNYVDVNSMIHKTGEELSNMTEGLTGVVFCTEEYGEDFSEGGVYEYENGQLIKVIELSGGASSNTNQSETITPLESNIAIGSEMLLTYNFKSKTSGKGTAKLFVGGVLKSTKSVERGENFFDVTQYIKEGSNYFTVTITDSNNATATFDYIVNGIKLTLKTTFNENIVYTGDITFTYTVIGAGVKTVTFVLDNNKIGETEVRSSGDQSKYTITGVTHGGHILKVKATTTLGDVTIDSNELSCRILYAEEGVTTPIISSSFNKTTAVEGESLSIDYLVYDPLNVIADVLLQVNDEEPTPAAVNRTKQYWSVSKYPVGDVIFKISCRDSSLSFPVTVEELNIDIEPVEDDLSLFLTGANRSNAELEEQRQTWAYNDIVCQLTNFNWVSNGWMNNALKMTGEARCFIPLNLFANDFKSTGKTIEIEFATRNIMNYNSILVSCYTENKGLQISATEAFFKTEQEEVKVRFKEDEKLRLSFVVEASGDNRLIKTYINGVLSGLTQYDSSDNFQQGVPVGISINDGGEEIDIYTIRIYDIALSSRQILNNYICDLTDINEKMTKYQANNVYDIFGSIAMAKIKSMLPILTITGPLPSVKGDKQTISTTYSDPINPALNFETENCTLDIQGTSSQYYPKKNYKIKFPEKFSFYEGAIPEKEYTFKADYMESSHSHNTGNAILVNTLYDEMFPTQTTENGVRNTIYGFPCAIYYRLSEDYDYEYFGAYNFNNDKGNSDTLGLTGEKAQSWEFKNNTSEHCLLRSADFSPEAKPEDNFEARYPDKYTDYTDLERVVSWVLSTDGDLEKFKSEFSQHFNLHYCLVYYVMMEVALMMDSRAKNMFWDTIDGNIWYPRMYDMDTCYGLNNEGVLNFGYGLEQHDANIYNGENSLFWNNFEECYAQEIKDMYLSLRSSGKISYENLMYIFKEHQIDKICEAQYNEDAKFKYINPINESNDTTYLYAAQGNRLSHFQWWVSNRLKYLDSKFEAPEYLADFITMRMYTKQGAITITPFTDQYLKIKYGSADVKIRATSGVPTLVPCPAGLEFNDTETIIYGANGIADIGDLSGKYPGTVDISRGLKLSKLKVGDSGAYENVHMTALTVGNNPLLRSIDVSNCPNLTGNLNVSGCTALREFYAGGTGLRGVTFVDGGDLEKVVLPRTLTNLTIKNHMNIESFEPSSFENLQTLVLQNTNLNASGILSANYKNLTRVYCKFPQDAGVDLHTFILDYLVENCKGIDDNGANTDYPNIQGYISVSYPSTYSEEMVQDMKDRYATAFPYLEITYRSVTNYFRYNASSNRVEFPVLTENLPATVLIPDADKIEPILGLAKGTINENTAFRISHTSNSSYKNTVEHIILPEGYASYYIDMEYFPNIKSFVFPKTKMKITYFNFNDSNSPYAPHIEELDFSAEGVDLTSCISLKLNLTNGSLKRFSLKNKTLSGTTGIGGNSGNGMFASMLTYSGTSSPIEEYNFENLKVTTAPSDFGLSAYSTKQCKLKATNMQLDKMKALRFSSLYRAEEVDLSGTSAPAATALKVSSDSSTQSSNYTKLIKLNNMYLPSLTSITNLCYYMMNLTELQMDSFSTDLVTDMSYAFYYCASMTDYSMLKNWNTGNVTTMGYMFSYNNNLTDFILDWKTPNLKTLSGFLLGCAKLQTFTWNNENATNLTSLNSMFQGNSKLQAVTMKGFDTSSVTNFSNMFYNNSALVSINDLVFNLDSATTTADMFASCTNLVNVNFDSETEGLNLTNMSNMFSQCSNLKEFNLPNFVGEKLTNMSNMFYYCKKLETVNLPNFIGEKVTNISQMFRGCSELKTVNMPQFLGSGVTATGYLFDQCVNIESINLDNFNAKITGSMANMFNGCSKVTEIYLSNLDTSKATSMEYAFANMPELKTLKLGDNFNTSNVTSFYYMFYRTPNIDYPIEKITFEKVTSVYYMFYGCNISEAEWAKITQWDFCGLTSLSYMFANAILPETLDFKNMNLTNITTFSMFNTDTTGPKTVNIDNVIYQDGKNMWSFVNSILDIKTLEHIDLSNCNMPMSVTYSGYSTGVGLSKLNDLKTFILPNLELTMKGNGISFLPSSPNVEVIKIKSVKSDWYSSDYTRFEYRTLFSNKTKLKEASVESLDFPHTNSNLYNLFYGCTSLEKIDMASVDTTENTRTDYMFYNCKAIENIDLSWMKTDNVNTMVYMFYGCSNLKTVNWEGFNFNKVTSLTSWFQGAGIENIVIDNIPSAPKLTGGTHMFADCKKLKTISFTDNVDFAQLTSITNWFNNCSSLEYVDMSKLLLTNCSNFTYMFKNCTSLLEVDLTNMTTTKNVNAEGLFYGCSSLQKVDMRNWPINKITTYQYKQVMFDGVPADCLVIVKDESCRSVLKTMAKHLTNVVLASELEETE